VLLNGGDDPLQIQDFSVGRTSWSISGGAALAWQASAKDSFTLDGNYMHQKSSTTGLSGDFDQYSVNFGYLRAINARTQIGVRNNITFFQTPGGPSSHSIGPALAVTHAFNAAWKLDADVGVILQRLESPINSSSTGLGFHLSLCGTYPRSNICLRASRSSSGSAFGGLRQQTAASIDYSYRMSERSTLSLGATYAHNKSSGIDLISDSNIFRGDIDYNRRLSERLSVGVEARGGYRKGELLGRAHSIAASAYLRVKIG
jgi:hypothetical protein